MKMNWTEGHLWKIEFRLSEVDETLEFKFVIKEGSHVVRWEEGFNHLY
jgi:hypothetical protein